MSDKPKKKKIKFKIKPKDEAPKTEPKKKKIKFNVVPKGTLKVGGKTLTPGVLVKPTAKKSEKSIEQERAEYDRIYALSLEKFKKGDKKQQQFSELSQKLLAGPNKKRLKATTVIGAKDSCGTITNPFTLRRIEANSRIGKQVMKMSEKDYRFQVGETIDKMLSSRKRGILTDETEQKAIDAIEEFVLRKNMLK